MIQYMKVEHNKEIELGKRNHNEMKPKIKTSASETKSSEVSLIWQIEKK